jgi:carbon-monoxide dehydrogenase large subunit
METQCIGKPVPRLDALDKVTGRAVYGVDVELPGMLYGAICRSTLSHARIKHIDLSEAKKSPGVRAVVTGKDLPFLFGAMIKDQPFWAIDRVRFVGEPIAAVAADTETSAQEAARKIRVTYEELPAVFDAREAAAEGAPLIHPNQELYERSVMLQIVPGTNICTVRTYSLGDMTAGFAQADAVFEDEFEIHSVAHTQMEPHSAVVQYSPTRGDYTIWASVDRPYLMAKELADALGISVNQVRYICHYVGGWIRREKYDDCRGRGGCFGAIYQRKTDTGDLFTGGRTHHFSNPCRRSHKT